MRRVLHLVSAPFPEYHGTTTRLIGLLSRIPHEIVLIIPDKINYGSIIESKEDKSKQTLTEGSSEMQRRTRLINPQRSDIDAFS